MDVPEVESNNLTLLSMRSSMYFGQLLNQCPFNWQRRHMDSLGLTHVTILELAFLFTIRLNFLTLDDAFRLGREIYYVPPLLPLSMLMETLELYPTSICALDMLLSISTSATINIWVRSIRFASMFII